MSNRLKLRELNGGRLTRPRADWTGRPRGTARRAMGRSRTLGPALQLTPPPTMMTNIRRLLASSKLSDR
jgi:hypothetical protein